MARISSYPRDLNIVDADSWIGTSVPGLQTRNFTASAVANYLNLNAKVNIGGQMSFKWSDTQNGGLATISKTGGGGSGTNFNTLTEIRISRNEINGQRVVEFLEYLIGTDILIGQGNEISQFGHYKLDTYVVDPTTTSYYIAGITFIGGNGVIAEEGTQYTVIDFNITGSGDVNLKQTFTSSNTWVINNTTGKAEPSVTLINQANDEINGEVVYTNATTITVTFNTNVAGASILN